MKPRARSAAASLVLAASFASFARAGDAPPPAATPPQQPALKICLNENLPPFSVRHGRTGFDVALADAIGEKLGAPVTIRWFESELDSDKSPSLEANALLSDGICDLVGNFALSEDTLEAPGIATSRLPDYDGAKAADRRRRVTLGVLIPSRPVRFAAQTVILGANAHGKSIKSLADLAGLKIGAESGTFGDTVLMRFGNERLVDDIKHVVPGRGELMQNLESGAFDAALLDLGRYDAYRTAHPDTKLAPSGFYYRTGFNMGFVALATQKPLRDRLDAALADLARDGKIEALAKAAGVTYLAPHEPAVTPHILMKDLGN
jgi:ABC-type amino acid transport substrate-binding protein